jgi:GDP-L-fucose synthase
MNVFITGGSGFVGKHLVTRLASLYPDYKLIYPDSKECNLFDSGTLHQFTRIKMDIIIHLAAWTQAGDFCLKYPGEQWINNQLINTNIINWWHEYQPNAKFVHLGTSCSYSPDVKILSENNYFEGKPIESLFTYAYTKRMLLQGSIALSHQFNHKWLCLIPSTIYGPNYHNDVRQLHFIFDLIRKILNAKKNNQDVILWGDGYQKREIIFIDDFINSLIKLIHTVDNEIINIGYGEEFSIRQFAKLICEIVEYDDTKIIYDKSKYVGAKSKCLDIEKI